LFECKYPPLANTAAWGDGEYMVLNKLARGSAGSRRAGFRAAACALAMQPIVWEQAAKLCGAASARGLKWS